MRIAIILQAHIDTGHGGLTIPPLWNPRPKSRNQTLNLDPPWATRPMDRRTVCPHLSGIEPPRADAKDGGPCSETD
ncbi:hypothetical protein DSO57_1031065 [Entomophthora muscae]|uniref:Uncharacterized protein n=1 Tax=Entomophthora muscae TaxID=34485 RepID=A0ACC2TZ16_9FUNG|nr:hypothetical protein DSO57_1031065 [Entomophthora muscae]